jgi:hypothetical protein
MATTSLGIEYPTSTGHNRLWEHFQTLADDIDALLVAVRTNMTPVTFATATNQTTTSTSFVAGSTECSVTLKAPQSGKFLVIVSGEIESTAGAEVASLSFEVRNGTTSAGSLFQAADAATSLRVQNSDNLLASRVCLVSGLVSGNDYFLRTMLATSNAANTASAFSREITVQPLLA